MKSSRARTPDRRRSRSAALETSLDDALSAADPGSAAGSCGRTIDEVIETVRRDGRTRHELFDSFLEGYGLIQKRLRRALASEQVAHIPCEGKPGRSGADDRDRSRRRTARPARDRGQGAEARLYLEGPRDPLRGGASGARGLARIAGRRPERGRSRRRNKSEIDVESHCTLGFVDRLDSNRLDSTRSKRGMTTWTTDTIIGIDLGTTNSEVAVIRDGRPVVLDEDGDPILPSVVGLDPQGHLLVGKAARNQYVLAPERTDPIDQAEDGPGGHGHAGRPEVLAAGNLGDHLEDAEAARREGAGHSRSRRW